MHQTNIIIIIAAILMVAGFVYYYTKNVETVLSINDYSSEEYKTKILPANMSDLELSNLNKDSFSFLTMIDAGSSGCRAHVYRYGKLGSSAGPIYIIPKHDSKKVKPGLSTFQTNPEAAGPSLQDLIDFIKEQVPEELWATTPVWLKATAGLRMLKPTESSAILSSVRTFLKDKEKNPFLFRDHFARIISGNEEGGFGWIAFNYLKKIIGPKKQRGSGVYPYAVVEMGGASSQVSQMAPTKEEAEKIPQEYRFSFTIEKETYHLYTHSYLGYGAEQAREALNKKLLRATGKAEKPLNDPCLYTGYTRDPTTVRREVYEGPQTTQIVKGVAGSGPKQCSRTLESLLLNTSSSCPIAVSTSFNCAFQPKFVTESLNFLVFENFYYVASATNVHSFDDDPSKARKFPLQTNIQKFENSAAQVCSQNVTELALRYPVDNQGKENNIKWCFSASYTATFLKALGIPSTKILTVQQNVEGSDIEWALGAAYKEAADLLMVDYLRGH